MAPIVSSAADRNGAGRAASISEMRTQHALRQVPQPDHEPGLFALRADGLAAHRQLPAGVAGQRDAARDGSDGGEVLRLGTPPASRTDRLAVGGLESEREGVLLAGAAQRDVAG